MIEPPSLPLLLRVERGQTIRQVDDRRIRLVMEETHDWVDEPDLVLSDEMGVEVNLSRLDFHDLRCSAREHLQRVELAAWNPDENSRSLGPAMGHLDVAGGMRMSFCGEADRELTPRRHCSQEYSVSA
jgi:hypothetical protein